MTKRTTIFFCSTILAAALLVSPFILLAQSAVNQQEIKSITEQIKSLTAKALTLEQDMQSAPADKKKEMAKESKKLNKEISALQKKLKKLQAVKQVQQSIKEKLQVSPPGAQQPPSGNQPQPPQAVEQPTSPDDSLKMIEEISFIKAEIGKRSEEVKLLETKLSAIEGPEKEATEKRIADIKEKIVMMEKLLKDMEKKPAE